MKSAKTILYCSIFLMMMCIPQIGASLPVSNMVLENSFTNADHSCGPRKKIKKKRKHPLDHKMKMKNGKRCPSM